MASIPIKLYKNYEIVTNDISLLITDSPNGSISSFDFINQIETCRNEKGNAYVLIERDIYHQPNKLYLFNPDVVVILIKSISKKIYYSIHSVTDNKLIFNNTD